MVAVQHKDRQPWAAAAALAGEQWGNVTTADLLRCGCSNQAIRSAVRLGRLFRVHQGVYALGKPPVTPHERTMAAVLAGGRGALLSHAWALWLWSLGRLPTDPPDVSVPRSRAGRRGVVFHRVTQLDPDRNWGIPLTTPARTLADCAPALTTRQLRRAVNQAQIAGLTQREKLMQEPRLRALVEAHGATRSILEELLLDLARRYGLPEPAINQEVHGVEVDFSYPGLVIEADGYRFHYTKIAFEDDHERRLYLESKGVRVVAVTYAQVRRRATAERLRTIIASSSGTPAGRR